MKIDNFENAQNIQRVCKNKLFKDQENTRKRKQNKEKTAANGPNAYNLGAANRMVPRIYVNGGNLKLGSLLTLSA